MTKNHFMHKFLVIILVGVIYPSGILMAGEEEALFVQANESYQTGNYGAAIADYNKILELGFESWEIYYNLGNAHYKDGYIAEAILNFERAKKLAPKNEDINFNLELANLSVVDRIPVLPKLFLLSWLDRAANWLNLSALAIVVLLSYLILIILLTLRLFVKHGFVLRMSTIVLVATTVFLVLSAGLFVRRIYENETRIEAVVMADRVDVLSAPGDSGTEVFTLHSGVKVAIQDYSGDWVKIRLSDGKLGWLRSDLLRNI